MASEFEIRVSSERLLGARDNIAKEANTFAQSMENISSLMRSLDEVWEGSAASEFTGYFSRLHANFKAYKEVINDQARALTESVARYEDKENMITNEVSKLDNSALFA